MSRGAQAEGISFRRPTEADDPAMVRVIDDWWGGREMDGCSRGSGSSTPAYPAYDFEREDRAVLTKEL